MNSCVNLSFARTSSTSSTFDNSQSPLLHSQTVYFRAVRISRISSSECKKTHDNKQWEVNSQKFKKVIHFRKIFYIVYPRLKFLTWIFLKLTEMKWWPIVTYIYFSRLSPYAVCPLSLAFTQSSVPLRRLNFRFPDNVTTPFSVSEWDTTSANSRPSVLWMSPKPFFVANCGLWSTLNIKAEHFSSLWSYTQSLLPKK